jgi:hypothetical protein
MSFLYNFPKQAAFGRVLSKSKIYEHVAPSTKIKSLFVQEIEKILWAYKLSPETLNLPASDCVQEIQVFEIELKRESLKHEVLHVIDKAIPFPILFILKFKNRLRYVAAYKRPSESDRNKWVVSGYFETEWVNQNATQVELPVVLNLGALYEVFIKNIIHLPLRTKETLNELVSRVEALQIKEREVKKIESRLRREKQFNWKVEINAQLRHIKQEIEEFKR